MATIHRGFVSPSLLSKSVGITAVKASKSLSNTERGNSCQLLPKCFSIDFKVAPTWGIGWKLSKGFKESETKPLVARKLSYCDRKAGFRRNGDLGMCVNHRTKESRAGSRRSDDDGHWGELRCRNAQ